jgi:hypothetical protein
MKIATIGFPLLSCFVAGCGLPEGERQKLYPGMPDYAAEVLRARYKKDGLYSATDLNEKDAAKNQATA